MNHIVEWSRCGRGEKRAYTPHSPAGRALLATLPPDLGAGAFLLAETDGYGAYAERTVSVYKRGDLAELGKLAGRFDVSPALFPLAHLWAVKWQPASARLGLKVYSLGDPEGLAARVPHTGVMGVGRTLGLPEMPEADLFVTADPAWMAEWASGQGLPCGKLLPGEHYLLHGVLFRAGVPTVIKTYSRSSPLAAGLQRARPVSQADLWGADVRGV